MCGVKVKGWWLKNHDTSCKTRKSLGLFINFSIFWNGKELESYAIQMMILSRQRTEKLSIYVRLSKIIGQMTIWNCKFKLHLKCKPFLEARDFYCQRKQTRLGIKFYQKKILVQVKGDDIKQHYYDHDDDLVFFWLDHTSILLFWCRCRKTPADAHTYGGYWPTCILWENMAWLVCHIMICLSR